MYDSIKQILLRLLPKSILIRLEAPLRYLNSRAYIGDKYQCNVCDIKLRNFIGLENDRLCPRCGSIQRNRRLWQLLSEEFIKPNQSILHFSPSRSIYRKMKKGSYEYVSSDLSENFISDVSFDIQAIEAADESYDLIICYHILEHIEDDTLAMKELWRVLKKDGYCLIQTPFKEGSIYEDNSITSPEEREIHFGQDDHVRIYSIEGLRERLENVGFEVEVRSFEENPENINGFAARETVLVCHKTA